MDAFFFCLEIHAFVICALASQARERLFVLYASDECLGGWNNERARECCGHGDCYSVL